MTETMTVAEYQRELAKPKAMSASEKTARSFLQQVRARRLPEPRSRFHDAGELRFAADQRNLPRQGKRKVTNRAPQWRFDFCWPELLVAVEVEGIVVMRDAETGKTRIGGRHAHVQGFNDDNEKYAWAAVLGWRLLRFTPKQVGNGFAIDMLVRMLTMVDSTPRTAFGDPIGTYADDRKAFGRIDKPFTAELPLGNPNEKDPF